MGWHGIAWDGDGGSVERTLKATEFFLLSSRLLSGPAPRREVVSDRVQVAFHTRTCRGYLQDLVRLVRLAPRLSPGSWSQHHHHASFGIGLHGWARLGWACRSISHPSDGCRWFVPFWRREGGEETVGVEGLPNDQGSPGPAGSAEPAGPRSWRGRRRQARQEKVRRMDQVIAGTASRKSDTTRRESIPSPVSPSWSRSFQPSLFAVSGAIVRSHLSYDGHLIDLPHPFFSCRVALPPLTPALAFRPRAPTSKLPHRKSRTTITYYSYYCTPASGAWPASPPPNKEETRRLRPSQRARHPPLLVRLSRHQDALQPRRTTRANKESP